MPSATLAGLVELRWKMGFRESFLGDEVMTRALEMTALKKGAFARVRAKAKAEEIKLKVRPATGAQYNVAAIDLLGPRGGLPRTKVELVQLARALGINHDGLTTDQLKHVIRPAVAAGDRFHESPAEKSGPTPPSESKSSEDKAWEWVDPREQKRIEETVANALRRIHADAPQDYLRAVTKEAVAQLELERDTRRRRLDGYIEADEEM